MRKLYIITSSVLALTLTLVLILALGRAQEAGAQNSFMPQLAQRAVSAASCGAIEIPLDMGDPFAIAYNPVHDYVYVLRTGTPQAAVLNYGREVARISFPTGIYRELTSIGVNPHSGLTYVTQWSNDRVHFINGTTLQVGTYITGYWGPAGVWSNPLTDETYVSGKWYTSTGKVAYFTGTTFIGFVDAGYNANPNAGVVAANNQYLYLANSNLDAVSVITGNSLLDTIHVGDHPNGIAYNPVNGYVYAVNRGTAATSSTVSIISGTTVVATVTLGPGYDEYLGVHPKDAITLQGNNYLGGTDIVSVDSTTGYVYVSNWGVDTVSVISGTALLTTLAVGTNPNSIVYNPVTGLVYVANTDSDTVTVIKGTDVIRTVPVGAYPIDLAVDAHSGLVYAVNRGSDSLSVIRCEDNLPEKRVLGHYMTWYETPNTYSGPACVNPDARGEWRMWNLCGHNPDTITGTHGLRDIAAVHYPLIGPYDSADPKVIEYHLLQALAAGIDTFVIDYYGPNDAGGIDEAALRVLQQVEDMNLQYGANFKLALMYDEGALVDQPDPFAKAMTDTLYILHTFAASPAYLWADEKPVLFYFPKGSILTSTQLATVTADFSLVYPDFPPDYLPVMDGAYAWVKAEPWQPDGSEYGAQYLKWFYRTLDYTIRTTPTLTFGVGAVWAGFNDVGVGEGWLSCNGYRWIDRQGGQVYAWTWDILDDYNAAVGITYTHPVSWVQLVTLNDYMEGTMLLASVEIPGVDGIDYGYGYGYQYVQQTENHASAFKGLPPDDELDIYVAQHVYNARLASSAISTNTTLIDGAVAAFHSGHYTTAMSLADQAAGIPAPISVTAAYAGDALVVSWQDQPGATLASGHRVYYGLESGEYVSSTEVLSSSSAALTGLTPQTTYYVAVTTLGATHPCEEWYVSESWYADEVMVPPILTSVTLGGPVTGVVNKAYTFTATVATTVGSAALPLTYTWQATGQPAPVTHTDGGLTDTLVFTWSMPGHHVVSVTVVKPSGAVSDTRIIDVYVPLSGVTITGPTDGLVNTAYVFTATATPPAASQPVTYTWSPEPDSDQGTTAATFTWTADGLHTVIVTATNPAGVSVSDTHTFDVYVPLSSVVITGPVKGLVNTAYVFTVTITPPAASQPITYTWSPEPDSSQGTTVVTFTWTIAGLHAVIVTATNLADLSVSDTHTITIEPYLIYLPIVLKNQ